jgi:hypothetical protein
MECLSVRRVATPGVAPAPMEARRANHRFYVGAALFAILFSAVGFLPSLIDPSRRSAPASPLAMAHGMVAGAWLLLLLAQATLGATGRIAIHRRLGMVSPGLAVAVIVLGYRLLIELARRGYDLSGDVARALSRTGRPLNPAGILLPLAELLEFGVLVGAALWYRHRPEAHKRLMVFALFPLLVEPALHLVGHLAARWPTLRGSWPALDLPVAVLLLSTIAVHDRLSRGKVHRLSLWVPVLLVTWKFLLVVVVLRSATWHRLAAWLTS